MFKAKAILYLYVETPLHAGSGRGMGVVDLPIQRERTTGYPIVQSGGVKGSLRAEAHPLFQSDQDYLAVFGPEADNASAYAGALSCGEARLLLFPVRSLAGVFAWTTSIEALARFERLANMCGNPINWNLPTDPTLKQNSDEAWVADDTLKAGDYVVLEEFSFKPLINDLPKKVGDWLAQNALPTTAEYEYWRKCLPTKLCILPENAFRDFALYGTEVQPHVKLNPDTKTVQEGPFWTESLPVDTLMYSTLMATDSRSPQCQWKAPQMISSLKELSRIQLGGDETTGQGIVALRLGGVA
jgi:CRISPR-associated protein Cmr4